MPGLPSDPLVEASLLAVQCDVVKLITPANPPARPCGSNSPKSLCGIGRVVEQPPLDRDQLVHLGVHQPIVPAIDEPCAVETAAQVQTLACRDQAAGPEIHLVPADPNCEALARFVDHFQIDEGLVKVQPVVVRGTRSPIASCLDAAL